MNDAMSDHQGSAAGHEMRRFAYAPLAEDDDARIRALWGRPPINLYRILGHQPSILRAWTEWNNDLRHGCELPRALRELIFLRSAHLQASAYEWTQHVAMARKAGLTEHKIEATKGDPSSSDLDDRERAILRATSGITDGHLSDAAFAALRAVFSAGEMIEVIVTASHACMLARVIQAIGVSTAGEDPAAAREGAD